MHIREAGFYVATLAGLLVLFTGAAFGQGISREDYTGLDKYLSDHPTDQFLVNVKAAEFLEIPIEARGVALGGAYSAVGTGISSLWWNPAGLSHLSSIETSVSYLRYNKSFSDGIDYTFFSAGVPLISEKLVVGGYLGYFDLPHLNVTTISNPDGNGEVFKPYDYQAAISVAYRIIENLSVGMSAKRVYQKFYSSTSGAALAVDAGALYEYNLSGQVFSVSLAVQNLGQDLKFKPHLLFELPDSGRPATYGYRTLKYGLPVSASLGLGYKFALSERAAILFAYEYRRPKQYTFAFKNIQSMGMEFSAGLSSFMTLYVRAGRQSFTLRRWDNESYYLGYEPQDRIEANGGFGLLFHFLGRQVQLDYARKGRDGLQDQDFFTLRVGI